MTIPVERLATSLAAAGLLVRVRGEIPDWVGAVTDDSRQVGPGDCFVAVRGSDRDGHEFLERAAASGARVAILDDPARTTLPALVVSDTRRAAAVVGAAAMNWPARRMRLVGVTGTNGKSTTVHLLRHLLDAPATPAGHAASIGTIGVRVGSAGDPLPDTSALTTPGPIELQRLLRRLVDMGVRTAAVEVSSHALDQRRVDGLAFDAVVFTNLTRDHLDYHGTMTAYRRAKTRLVAHLSASGTLVVNDDSAAWRGLHASRRLTYGLLSRADVRGDRVRYEPSGSQFRLFLGRKTLDARLPLIGDFNVGNALGAAAAALALGESPHTIAARLASVPQVPGRLEVVHAKPMVLRDYAHTPDALERALTAVRPFTHGRLIVVFGAGGDRDRGKRPRMGAVAARLADIAIVTSDNPRTEDPERILDDIEAGMGSRGHERIEDRRTAIVRALDLAGPADVVVLAGKGHETYQVRGIERLPFDESQIVAELMRGRT